MFIFFHDAIVNTRTYVYFVHDATANMRIDAFWLIMNDKMKNFLYIFSLIGNCPKCFFQILNYIINVLCANREPDCVWFDALVSLLRIV